MASFIKTVVVTGEPVLILTAAIQNLTRALDELTTAHVKNLLETEAMTEDKMRTLDASRSVRRFRDEMQRTLENAKRAWKLS